MSTYEEKKRILKKLKMVRRHNAPATQVFKVKNRRKRKHVREELNQYKGSFRGFKHEYDE